MGQTRQCLCMLPSSQRPPTAHTAHSLRSIHDNSAAWYAIQMQGCTFQQPHAAGAGAQVGRQHWYHKHRPCAEVVRQACGSHHFQPPCAVQGGVVKQEKKASIMEILRAATGIAGKGRMAAALPCHAITASGTLQGMRYCQLSLHHHYHQGPACVTKGVRQLLAACPEPAPEPELQYTRAPVHKSGHVPSCKHATHTTNLCWEASPFRASPHHRQQAHETTQQLDPHWHTLAPPGRPPMHLREGNATPCTLAGAQMARRLLT